VANIFFIGSLVAGVVSTIVIVWMATVKESHWDNEREASKVEIQRLSTEGEASKAEIARANERAAALERDAAVAGQKIAEATARAFEAQLALERFKAPRQLSESGRSEARRELSKYAGAKAAVYVAGEGMEPAGLAGSIIGLLNESHWEAFGWSWVGAVSAAGVIVLYEASSGEEVRAMCAALSASLNSAGVQSDHAAWPGDWASVGGMLNGPQTPRPTSAPIRIIVGNKPQ
jgi:hypothetical protein